MFKFPVDSIITLQVNVSKVFCINCFNMTFILGLSQTTAELSKAHLQKLRSQEQRLKRRLHSIHRKFANVPENSEVSNCNGATCV